MKLRAEFATAAIVAMAFTGCANKAGDVDTRNARYIQAAGAPVESFPWVGGPIERWWDVASDKLVVWTGVDTAYLLTVQGPCLELAVAQGIEVTHTAGVVNRGFDYVEFGRHKRCQIIEIRPVDYKKVREAEAGKAPVG